MKMLGADSRRTTLIGLVVLVMVLGAILGPPDIREKMLGAAIAIAGGGLIAAKDSGK